MQTETEFQTCASKLKALAQSTRLRIVQELFQAPRLNVSQICARLDESIVNVSHHLGILKSAEIVGSTTEGREVYYWLVHGISAQQHSVELGCCRLNLDDKIA